ncbi:hypothetical protein [Hymenobacter sp. DG25A]|uniref:hypothetical protein n=1 Tax=Hymenobacter sp. DG25A TaxID=1385663 RepID=UPI0006BC0FFC|nr:hypothetical protein [Hymenobacter sp. DG25A]ALD20715.1 hypothetical protein AM218_05125 [Hymenobacter sp. DG25A]
MRHSFLFDPNKNSLFYLALFLALAAAGLTAYHSLSGHYSIVGSVASFLGLFVAFQSWKAADEASRKTDEALTQMHNLAAETRQLVQSSNAVEAQIQSAVVTISDATRELYKGFEPIMTEIGNFLEAAAGSDFLAVLTDSATIGKFYAEHHQPPFNQREMLGLTTRIHDQLVARARDTHEFYLATLAAEEAPANFPPPREQNPLFHSFVQGIWQRFNPNVPLEASSWDKHRLQHQAALREIQAAFTETADLHQLQLEVGLSPLQFVPVLPLQLFLRFDAKAKEPFRALVVFLGQYNLDRVADARGMQSADPELVRSFISMFESLSSLDDQASYQQLRQQCPL